MQHKSAINQGENGNKYRGSVSTLRQNRIPKFAAEVRRVMQRTERPRLTHVLATTTTPTKQIHREEEAAP